MSIDELPGFHLSFEKYSFNFGERSSLRSSFSVLIIYFFVWNFFFVRLVFLNDWLISLLWENFIIILRDFAFSISEIFFPYARIFSMHRLLKIDYSNLGVVLSWRSVFHLFVLKNCSYLHILLLLLKYNYFSGVHMVSSNSWYDWLFS